jgi:hypothetical protein
MPLSAQPVNVDAAKKEGKVVVYGLRRRSHGGLAQAFKKKYGIEIEYWRGSSTRHRARLTEWRAGKRLMMWSRPAACVDHEGRRAVYQIHPAGLREVSRSLQRERQPDYTLAGAADQHPIQHGYG